MWGCLLLEQCLLLALGLAYQLVVELVLMKSSQEHLLTHSPDGCVALKPKWLASPAHSKAVSENVGRSKAASVCRAPEAV